MPAEGQHQGEIPSRGMPSQREIAYHEAGHAVIALGFGESVRRATIKPRAGSRGQVTLGGRQCGETALYITLAGPLAQRRFAPRSNWLTGDFAIAEKMIFGKGSSGTAAVKEKYLTAMVASAEQIVDFFWIDIKVAAKALLKHETLTGDEISAAIRAARRKKRRRRGAVFFEPDSSRRRG